MYQDILKVICPHCGEENNTPCIYDGSYELRCSGCDKSYFIIIKNGAVHVFSLSNEFDEYRKLLFE